MKRKRQRGGVFKGKNRQRGRQTKVSKQQGGKYGKKTWGTNLKQMLIHK